MQYLCYYHQLKVVDTNIAHMHCIMSLFVYCKIYSLLWNDLITFLASFQCYSLELYVICDIILTDRRPVKPCVVHYYRIVWYYKKEDRVIHQLYIETKAQKALW